MNSNVMKAFASELYIISQDHIKEAAKKDSKSSAKDKAIGAASIGAGGLAVSKANPYLTGRTKVYHGGDAGLAAIIQREGLRTRKQRGVKSGITDAFTSPKVSKLSEDLAFVTARKGAAQSYAEQKRQARRLMKANPGMSLNDALVAARGDSEALREMALAQYMPGFLRNKEQRGAVAEMNIPLWKLREQGKIVHNPEVDDLVSRLGTPYKSQLLDALGEPGGTYSIKGGVDKKYVRGAANYKGPDLAEIGEYARKHKKRFTGGALGTLGGLGLGAYGISRLLPKKEKSS